MKNLIDNILYHFLWCLFYLVSLLPLRVLYLGADGLAWLACCVVRYRRRVVESNLRSSFPQMSDIELKKTVKGFYRFLGDYFVETLKLASMSKKEISRRVKFINIEALDRCTERGQDVSLYLGHYGNWEWSSFMSRNIKGYGLQVYHPLENKAVDKLFLRLRGRYGAKSVPMAEIFRELMRQRKADNPTVTGYIADQAPIMQAIHCWLPFLNHDTPVFTGAEKISAKLKASAFYVRVSRPRRGYYNVEFIPICDDVSKMRLNEVTAKYFLLLEEDIRRRPELWLWSHNRWKRHREDWLRVIPGAAQTMADGSAFPPADLYRNFKS